MSDQQSALNKDTYRAIVYSVSDIVVMSGEIASVFIPHQFRMPNNKMPSKKTSKKRFPNPRIDDV